MNTTERLEALREKARKEMEAAMKAGKMDGVIKFARIIKEADDALQGISLAVERMLVQLESDHEGFVTTGPPRPERMTATSDFPSRKERGKARRDEYLRGLLAKGIQLSRLKGRTFQTSFGKRVGIAYASEDRHHPDTWWMGLPDERYDVVVLLCETSSGHILDFVLPPDFVNRVWRRLTLSKKQSEQREWHVVRSGPNYDLEPKKRLGQITTYLSRLDPLR